ncbi:MAG: DUF3574 domain-containing protein [Chromatiales bacterium]
MQPEGGRRDPHRSEVARLLREYADSRCSATETHLTLLSGTGQFKDSTGTIIQEGSKLLILLYPFNKESNRAVEKIREEYKKDFQQESTAC